MRRVQFCEYCFADCRAYELGVSPFGRVVYGMKKPSGPVAESPILHYGEGGGGGRDESQSSNLAIYNLVQTWGISSMQMRKPKTTANAMHLRS